MIDLFSEYFILSLVVFLLGLYCVVSQGNLIKIVIGIEIMGKGVILNFIMAGFFQNNTGIAQAVVVTAILIDAVIAAVILALVVNVFRLKRGILADQIAGLKG
ncbi:MAG TPA: NADH-quinone oxidoreductase subunit K [Methanomicrobiales archaeon]|jgi:NADH:ubiquinone oxidoreductase subunit K|nr:NADH-quinone oxidoreductase subunit K [Methanomicrobiales archaeon]